MDYFNTNSSDDEDLSVNSQDRNSECMLTPEKMRKTLYSPSQRKHTEEEVKHSTSILDEGTHGYASDGSDKASIPEEAPLY